MRSASRRDQKGSCCREPGAFCRCEAGILQQSFFRGTGWGQVERLTRQAMAGAHKTSAGYFPACWTRLVDDH